MYLPQKWHPKRKFLFIIFLEIDAKFSDRKRFFVGWYLTHASSYCRCVLNSRKDRWKEYVIRTQTAKHKKSVSITKKENYWFLITFSLRRLTFSFNAVSVLPLKSKEVSTSSLRITSLVNVPFFAIVNKVAVCFLV